MRSAGDAAQLREHSEFRRPKSTADPPEESVNETVARLLAGAPADDPESRHFGSRTPPLVLRTETRKRTLGRI